MQFTVILVLVIDQLDDLPGKTGPVILISRWVLHRHRQLWRERRVAPERFINRQMGDSRFANPPVWRRAASSRWSVIAITEATIVLSTPSATFRIQLSDTQSVLPGGNHQAHPA